MKKSELFEKAKVLVDIADKARITGKPIDFKTPETKLTLQAVFAEINAGIRLEISCDDCVRNALNILTSWYGREYPLYLKSLPVEPINIQEAKTGDNIHFSGIAQKNRSEDTVEEFVEKPQPKANPVNVKKSTEKERINIPDVITTDENKK